MDQVSHFGNVLLFVLGGIVFVAGGLITSKIIRPNRPDKEKLTTYESGEDPVGNAWGFINIRFYVIALIFLLFEVELIFLFPWAIVFGNKELIDATDGVWGWFALTEAFLFMGILALGLAYVWRKGYLDWEKPTPIKPTVKSAVPKELYDKWNKG